MHRLSRRPAGYIIAVVLGVAGVGGLSTALAEQGSHGQGQGSPSVSQSQTQGQGQGCTPEVGSENAETPVRSEEVTTEAVPAEAVTTTAHFGG